MILVGLLLLLLPTQIDFDFKNQFIIWNIGQGQWITTVEQQTCYHFDVGGEFFNPNEIAKYCLKKKNIVFYSHWDWDHIGLTSKLKNNVKNICIAKPPLGTTQEYKKNLLNKISLCEKSFPQIKTLNFNYKKSKSDNDLSQIYIYQERFLIPGDSTKKMEKIWAPLLSKKIKWLSVSHHGSKTSTSKEFLNRIPQVKQAFVSARKKVYGHPHKGVMKRLAENGIATLKTEDWGNLHILLK